MMRARQGTNSLDARSDVVPLAVPTATIAGSALGAVLDLAEEGDTEAGVGINCC